MKKQGGQVILMLILVMSVALAIGLSVIQKSLTDVSTSTKVEQSARAFSAAEAGIEKALQVPGSIGVGSTAMVNLPETNSQAQVQDMGLMPAIPSAGTRQVPLEYPPLSKEKVAHVWLADLNSTTNPPATYYTQNSLDIYWGSSDPNDKAALELTLVYYDGSKYQSRKWYLDQTVRTPPNNFDTSPNCTDSGHTIGTNKYRCHKKLGDGTGVNNDPLQSGLMLLRARLLYNSQSQPFAVQAVGICGAINCYLPPQARQLISRGQSGQTQRTVRLFQEYKVVPPYFDYAIFSVGEIRK